jgi:3'-phosphoadenosine 5'-phosphosulfate sulfotransferase (PAPS reductase)/FAD synthetase
MKKSSFKLKHDQVQISFSGGRTSAFMLYQILEKNNGLPENVKVVFTNTGREMDQTLDFVQECSERWNVPIVWLEYDIVETKNSFKIVNHNSASRNGEPFEKLIERYGRLPNALQRFCTGVLKLQTASKYLKSFGWKYWHNALGIRSDEKHRTKEGLINGWYFGFYPLVDAGVSLDQINNFWKKQPFDLKLPVVKGKSLKGNCDCCFLKSEHILAMMFREHPEKAKWWIDIESKYKKKFNRDRGLVDFNNYINNQQDWVFNQQGYFCQADGGECTG